MRRRRNLPAILLATLAVVATGGCDALFSKYCDRDSDCADDQVCNAPAGVCETGNRVDAGVVEDGGVDDDAGVEQDAGVAFTISSVEGNGTARAVEGPPTNIDGGVLSGQRIRDGLVVQGTGLDAVEDAQLIAADATISPLAIAPARSDGEIELILPSNISVGLSTLTLASLSTVASAQVFIVQGEAAPPIVSIVSAADTGQCPTGGRVLTVGPDADGNGQPDTGEPVVICNGASGNLGELVCDAGDCTISANLDVAGSLTVASRDVVQVIISDQTRSVTSIAEFEAELLALQAFRIHKDATVTLQFDAGEYIPATN